MPVTGDLLKFTINWTLLGERCQTRMFYETDGAAFLTATMLGVTEAYWADIKTLWRAAMITGGTFATTDFIDAVEYNGLGGIATYAIPAIERAGTRVPGAPTDMLPTFMAARVRLTVGTAVTRSGQKRFGGGFETDIAGGVWETAYIAIIDALAAKFDTAITLGAPVATGILHPCVATEVGIPPMPTVFQRTVGHITNTQAGTQTSRRKR